ncbi:hypothetical protein BOV91_09705 [Solemya velum gill symbiont]|nr:hypothetical protein BOV91_09705 [Solemya velum gill symbiont]
MWGSRIWVLLLSLFPLTLSAQSMADQGQYLLQLANCYSCHTDTENDGPALAGGRRLETELGIFWTPNITPDSETGIGHWSDEQFIAAVRHGRAPDGSYYFPAFPYPAYRNMEPGDILAIKAYLFSQAGVRQENRPHELNWYVKRWLMPVWTKLNELLSPDQEEQAASRGAYLVDTLGHCNECHTPRNRIGILDWGQRLRGNKDLSAPDISWTDSGIGQWSDDELVDLFRYGALPDGDYVADHMAEVVEYSTSKWSEDDLKAAISYIRTIQ